MDYGCLSCDLCHIQFSRSLCSVMAGSSYLKTIISLFGQHDFFPAQRQGTSPTTRARLSPQVSHPCLGTIFCKRYHRDGFCLHSTTNPGKNDIKKLGLLIIKLTDNRSAYLPCNGPISGYSHSFIGTRFIQQIKHQYG